MEQENEKLKKQIQEMQGIIDKMIKSIGVKQFNLDLAQERIAELEAQLKSKE